MKKIKIIHLITRLDSGGSAENTFLTAREFRRRGYETAIWAGTGFDLPREIKKEAEESGIPLLFIPSLVRSIHPLKDLRALITLCRLLKKEKPDILHTHTSKTGFLGRLAGRLAGVPVRVHTPHGHVFYGYFGPLKTRFFIFLEWLAARWTDAIIPLTAHGVAEHLARGIGKREQLVAIPSGVDFLTLAFSKELRREMRGRFNIPESAWVVGSLGRFVPIKGFDLIVEAAPQVLKSFPSAYFYLAGVGPMKEKLVQKIGQMGLEKKFIFDDFQEVLGPLHLIDIFLLPSRNEGQSRTLVQAMALQKGIVASAVGGVPDVIQNGVTGLLVPPNDSGNLARAILELLQDPNKIRRMGEAASREARSRFGLQGMIDLLEQLYQRLLSQKKRNYEK